MASGNLSDGRPEILASLTAILRPLIERGGKGIQSKWAAAAGTTQATMSRQISSELRLRIDEFAGILGLYGINLPELIASEIKDVSGEELPKCVSQVLRLPPSKLDPRDRRAIAALAHAGAFDGATTDDVLHFWIHLQDVREGKTSFWPPQEE